MLRGYDQAEVDAVIEKARTRKITPDELRAASFTVAMRGYDRSQVEEYAEVLASHLETMAVQRAELATRLAESDDPWRIVRELLATIVPETIDVVLRGYDRAEVDALAARIKQGEVSAEQLRATAFASRWRGYDREQVDTVLAECVELLDMAFPPGR